MALRNTSSASVTLPLQTGSSDDWREIATGFEFSNYTYRTLSACFILAITPIGVIGNSMVIIAVCLSRKLQTKTNLFVINLASLDLLNCAFFPVQVTMLLHRGSSPPRLGPLCPIAGAIVITTNVGSVVTLAVIAVTRCVKIIKSGSAYHRLFTRKVLACMIAVCWCYPILTMVVPRVAGLGSLGYSNRYKLCLWSDEQQYQIYMSMMLSLSFILAFGIITVCYVTIVVFVRIKSRKVAPRRREQVFHISVQQEDTGNSAQSENAQQGKQQRGKPVNAREIKVTQNLAIVICTFFLCIMPYGVCTLIPGSYVPFICLSHLLLFNSIINPFIYAMKHPVFSQVFRCIFTCSLRSIPEPTRELRSVLNMT
ncbi:melatonin receptor type 1B-A-like [Diadema setosum]|uniref:melatonin receptor type 1B-A-like n=1 Tax=Diadema setosum TaxID=31175 RepID=UPI003B3AE1A3